MGNSPKNGIINESSSMGVLLRYVSSSGYDDSFAYHTEDIMHAGTAYINDFSGELFLARNDAEISGNIMPVSVSFMYNSGLYNRYTGNKTAKNVYGNNWLTTYNRTLFIVGNNLSTLMTDGMLGYTDENGRVVYFVQSEDENGNIVFKQADSETLGDDGYQITGLDLIPDNLTTSGLEYLKLVKSNGETESFDTLGRLIKIEKTSHPDQSINIVYSSDLSADNDYFGIDYILDGVGRKYDFTYNNDTGLLFSIVCYTADGTQIKAPNNISYLTGYYYYENGNMIRTALAGTITGQYEYNENNLMTSATSSETYKMTFSYSNSGKVASVSEFARPAPRTTISPSGEFEAGNVMTKSYNGHNQTTFTDSAGNVTVEQFDNYGRPVCVNDNKGNYSYNSYDSSDVSCGAAGNTKVASNLLLNNSFENNVASWTCNGISDSDVVTTVADSNYKSLHFMSNTTVTKSISQTIAVTGKNNYTFSAYIKPGDNDTTHMLTMKIITGNFSAGTSMEETRQIAAVGGEFSKYSVQISSGLEEANYVTVEIGFADASGEFYVDSLQLEQGNGTSNYDYLTNGSLRNYSGDTLDGWTSSSDYSSASALICGNTYYAVKLSNGSSLNSGKGIAQSVTLNGKTGDILSFGGWIKANAVYNGSDSVLNMFKSDYANADFTTDRTAGIVVQYNYTATENGQQVTKTDTQIKNINSSVNGWQYISENVELKGDCTAATVSFIYMNHPNDAYGALFSLTKSAAVAVPDNEEAVEEPETPIVDEKNDNETYCVCGDDCAYGAGCTCSCASEAECTCSQCKKKFDISYDDYGNLLSLSINGYDMSTLFSMFTAKTYTSDGNYKASETNENNKQTQYLYDQANGYLKSQTDARGNTTEYTYKASGNIASIKTNVSGIDEPIATSSMNTYYYYDYSGRIRAINHNGFSYAIFYDAWGNVSRVDVGQVDAVSQSPLVSYAYGTGEFRSRLNTVTYRNGATTEYTYDTNGNITEIENSDNAQTNPQVSTYKYYYDSEGGLLAEIDEISGEALRYTFYNNTSVEIYQAGSLQYYAAYDEEGNFVENINGTVYLNKSYDTTHNDETGKNTVMSAVISGNQAIGISALTDTFGRTEQKTLLSKDPKNTESTSNFAAVLTNYTYKGYTKDNKSMVSSQVDTVQNKVSYGSTMAAENVLSDETLAYDYDDNNNITYEYSVSSDGARTVRYHYIYDEANQLTRVDDNVSQTTTTYSYDMGGNRTSVKTYAYTLGMLGTPVSTKNATYGIDANDFLSDPMLWNDRLNTFDGKKVSYDREGNPTSYDGKTYTWNGKQLKQVKAADDSYTQYDYDINGLRIQKRQYKADGVLECSVDYIWSDGKIISQSLTYYMALQKDGVVSYVPVNISSKFIYESGSNSPYAIMLNDAEFLLVRNLQGDVTKVINAEDGSTYVYFTYDAWGNVTYNVDGVELDDISRMVITALCPVTYRGYNYDFTTGLYYLQSRYYNPQWGRFLNTDDTSILLSSTGTTHGANMYLYCDNNPVNRVDYTGRYPGEYDWLRKMFNEFAALGFTYIVLFNKKNILPSGEIIENACTFGMVYDNITGCGYIKSSLVFKDNVLGNIYFNMTIDLRPNYEWDFYLDNAVLNYAKIGLNEGSALYSSWFGPINSGIDIIDYPISVGDLFFSASTYFINKIPEDRFRRFIRKEMDYQRQFLTDSAAILINFESYRIKHYAGRDRVTDYQSYRGYESYGK